MAFGYNLENVAIEVMTEKGFCRNGVPKGDLSNTMMLIKAVDGYIQQKIRSRLHLKGKELDNFIVECLNDLWNDFYTNVTDGIFPIQAFNAYWDITLEVFKRTKDNPAYGVYYDILNIYLPMKRRGINPVF
jgi:hypothetical protein